MRPEKNVVAAVPASPCHSGRPASVCSASGSAHSASATATCACGDGLQRLLALRREHREQRRKRGLQARDEILGGTPVVGPQAADGAMAAAPAGDRLLGARQRFGDAVDAAAQIHVAKGGDLQRPRGTAHGEGIEPEPRQRVLQQRHHGGRREVLGGGGDDEIEERAGRRLGERAAGGVVDADAPSFQAHSDAAGEQPVW